MRSYSKPFRKSSKFNCESNFNSRNSRSCRASAIASAKLTGLGQKDEADAAAVEAMRLRMGKIEMKGKIVIGEGERDEAPMLYIGEEVGSGSGPGLTLQ